MRDSPICGPAGAPFDADDVAAQPVAVPVALAGYLLGQRQHALDGAEVDEHGARVGALLDDARDDIALTALEVAEDLLVLEVAQSLDDDLPRRGGGHPTEPVRGVVELRSGLTALLPLAVRGRAAARRPRGPTR